MKTMTKFLASAVTVALLGVATPASAKLSDAEVARLGADLTPMGAEKAGNKDGTIPAWTGGLCAPQAGWTAAKGYVDPFAGDNYELSFTDRRSSIYTKEMLLVPVDEGSKLTPQEVEPGIYTRSIPVMQDPKD